MARFLYNKNQQASLASRKASGSYTSEKPWQSLLDQGATPPTEEEQKQANTKYTRNTKKKKEGKELEPFSPREQWAKSLYKKNQQASLASRKASGSYTESSRKCL